jgi:hypothetical protein
MKIYAIHGHDPRRLDRAVKTLRRRLRKGDIILTGPIPRNFKTRFLNVVLMITRRVFRGITHACLYLGDDYILDIDYHLIERDRQVVRLSIHDFIKYRMDNFGGMMIYVVRPRVYYRSTIAAVVREANEVFVKNSRDLRHSYIGSIRAGWHYLVVGAKNYKEDLRFHKVWHCGEMVAHILKKANTPIGKRACFMFMPITYARSKHFKVQSKIILD